MKSIMVKVCHDFDVSALHIVGVTANSDPNKKVCIVQTTTGIVQADCDKAEMKKRIDAAWEGR